MSPRRSLGLPITLAVVMIALLVVLTVGWVLLAVFGALANTRFAGLNWTLLSVGTAFIALLLVGVVMYLGLSIKTINLSRRQSNFIHSVTHELKSPIASMKLCLQTLNRRQVSREEQAGFHQFMLEDLDRLDRLINHVLEAGRLDTAPADGEVEEVAMENLLDECADTVCLWYRVPSCTVRLDVPPCSVRARRLDLEMIFRNLIDNAVKYAGTEPRVEVVLRLHPNGNVVTQVCDNGKGIPYKLRTRIFGRFVRLGLELEREKPGTGLGLHIVRTLVRRLGGQVRVRDHEPGPGAVFEVDLPARLVVAQKTQPQEDNPLTEKPEVA
ncbi:MAG TPA: HAMP domain-containing sensor histidine kinase [Thermoguttaceae bacterium]|nr:HAMP domain-containing sensor histidine kinase [Thermoguttaceae bacterium]